MREIDPEITERIVLQLYGDLYQRDVLNVRQRALISVSVAAAADLAPQLHYQVRFAILAGVSSSELREAMLHVGLFAGMARAINASSIISYVQNEIENSE